MKEPPKIKHIYKEKWEETVQQAINLVTAYKKPQKIILFGSRASGNFSQTSDIDLAIVGPDWSSQEINMVKNQLEELISTPLKFDLVHVDHITKESLRRNILQKGKVVYGS